MRNAFFFFLMTVVTMFLTTTIDSINGTGFIFNQYNFPCTLYTIDKCTFDENQILDTLSDISNEDCQFACRETYKGECIFFMYNETGGSCVLTAQSFKQYTDSCLEIGGPSEPIISECIDDTDPCNMYIEGECAYEGDLLDTFPDIPNAAACQVASQPMTIDEYFLYTEEDRMCYLVDSSRKICKVRYGPPEPSSSECMNPPSSTTSEPTSSSTTPAPTSSSTMPAPTSISTTTSTTSSVTTNSPSTTLKILIVGGIMDNSIGTSDVEYINPFATTNTCKKKDDFPAGIAVNNCGSEYLFTQGHFGGDTCELVNNSWAPSSNLLIPRYDASCVRLSNGSFWISGGYNSDGDDTQTWEGSEIKIDDGLDWNFIPSVDLPEPMVDHCMARVNDTHLFIVGNFNNGKMAYLVDTTEDKFIFQKLPDMISNRWRSACGSMTVPKSSLDEDGDQLLIVAGGTTSDCGIATSEIFSMKKYNWTEGPELPRGFARGGMYSDEDHPLIMIGGKDVFHDGGCNITSDLMTYQRESNTFEVLPAKLDLPRYEFAATGVFDDEDC